MPPPRRRRRARAGRRTGALGRSSSQVKGTVGAAPVTLPRVVARIVLLSDRLPDEVLPAVGGLVLDIKTEHLSVESLPHARELAPEAVLVDAAENPAQAHAVLRALQGLQMQVPIVVVLGRADLDLFSWAELRDEFLYPGAPQLE